MLTGGENSPRSMVWGEKFTALTQNNNNKKFHSPRPLFFIPPPRRRRVPRDLGRCVLEARTRVDHGGGVVKGVAGGRGTVQVHQCRHRCGRTSWGNTVRRARRHGKYRVFFGVFRFSIIFVFPLGCDSLASATGTPPKARTHPNPFSLVPSRSPLYSRP